MNVQIFSLQEEKFIFKENPNPSGAELVFA